MEKGEEGRGRKRWEDEEEGWEEFDRGEGRKVKGIGDGRWRKGAGGEGKKGIRGRGRG